MQKQSWGLVVRSGGGGGAGGQGGGERIMKVQFLKRVRFRRSFLCLLKVHTKSE